MLNKNVLQDNRGIAVPLALILLSIMSFIAVFLANYALREITTARLLNSSVNSYYASEAGIERALDIVQYYRESETSLADTITALDGISNIMSTADAGWILEVTPKDEFTSATTVLPRGETFQVENFDIDDTTDVTDAAESMVLYWDDSCGGNIQVDIVSFSGATLFNSFYDLQNGFAGDRATTFVKGPLGTPSSYSSNTNISSHPESYYSIFNNGFNSNTNEIVRITPLSCDIDTLTVEFYTQDDAAGDLVALPSQLEIASIGTSGDSSRRITARSKWTTNASGLTSFVLFSIDRIIK